jgi:WD40 repeat protein
MSDYLFHQVSTERLKCGIYGKSKTYHCYFCFRSPGAPLYDISGHVGHVLAVDWSHDGLIASGGKDSTIKTYRR